MMTGSQKSKSPRWRRTLNATFALLIALVAAASQLQAAPASRPLAAGRESWYAIRWQSSLIGFSRFAVQETVELGGDRFYVINSESRVKLGVESGSEAIFSSRLVLDKATLHPSLFVCSQRQGALDLRVECLFTPRLVAQKNGQGTQEVSSTVSVDAPPHLVFNNVWGRVDTLIEHYAVLLSAWQSQGEKDAVLVYEPVLRGTETLRFRAEGTASVSVLGRGEQPARIVTVSDRQGPMVKAWLAVSNGRLLRLDDLRGGFVFTLSDARVEALFKKAVGVNLLRDKLDLSNVYFPDASSLRTFRATIDVRVAGQPTLARSINGFQQSFDGVVGESGFKGTVDVQTRDVTVKASTPYPRREPHSGDLTAFTLAEAGIEARDDEIRSKGEEVAWRARTSWEAAQKICTWIHDNVADGYSMPSGRFVLQHMSGNSESKALLAVTLLRSLNIPARRVSGVIFDRGYFAPHAWVEVWVGDTGWVAIDPTTGESGTLGASHVAFGDLSELSSLDVKVLSYSPLPAARVPFFTRELAWPVGQRRVYSIVHGGKQIGTEVAQVMGLTRVDSKDAYDISFQVDRTLDGKRLVGSYRLLTTTDVLPRRFTSEGAVDGQRWSNSFDFTASTASESIKVGDETKVQQTPLSEGSYVVDPHCLSMFALVVGQLPQPGLGTRATVHLYDPQTHRATDMVLQIRQEEKVGVAGEEKDTWRCESTDGVSFFLEKSTGQVIRIEAPRQDMVLQLVECAIKI